MTAGCLLLSATTYAPAGFLSTFLRWQATAVAAAWLAILLLVTAVRVRHGTDRHVRMFAAAEVVLCGVAGGIVGAFHGAAIIGFVVFVIPAGLALSGALAGRTCFRTHPRTGLAAMAVGATPAVAGWVVIFAGW